MSHTPTVSDAITYEWSPAMRARPASEQHRPSLPDAEWQRVDARFAELSAQLHVNFHVILTDRFPNEICHSAYVYLEPLGHVVLTLGTVNREAVIWTDPSCSHEEWATICDDIEKLMRQDRLVDALLFAFDNAYTCLSGLADPNPVSS